MWFYVVVMLSLWVIATLLFKVRDDLGISSILVVAVFLLIAGLRFETGYDWMVYESALEGAPSLLDFFSASRTSEAELMEPLFLLTLSLIREIGGDIQVLFVLVAVFNSLALVRFLKFCGANMAVCLAIYFSWLYLPLQMGVIRQSIAVSFLMLSLVEHERGRNALRNIYFLVGFFFHFSTLLFLPIFLRIKLASIIRFRYFFVLIALAIPVIGVNVFQWIGRIAGIINFEFVSIKMQQYSDIGPTPFSPAAFAYLTINCLLFLVLARRQAFLTKIESSLLLSIGLMIFFQALFWQFPLLWNRVQYLAVVGQSVMLCRRWALVRGERAWLEFGCVSIFSIIVFLKTIVNPFASPYIPYQSYVWHLVTEDEGSGRVRTEAFYKDFVDSLSP